MKVKIDGHEVEALDRVIKRAAGAAYKDAQAVVTRGALNIKRDAARRISGLRHARAYPRAISYDAVRLAAGPAADIGPDKHRTQGPLGNLLEYGSANNPPHPHMRPAAAAELPKFERALGALARQAMEGR